MSTQPFSLCINTSTIKVGRVPLPQAIEIAADAGYDGIEPWISEVDTHTASGGTLQQLSSLAAGRGLSIVNLIGFFDWAVDDSTARVAGLEEARRSFAMAEALSCPFVAAPPWHMTDEVADLEAIADRYAAVVDVARDFGVIPLLEYWGHSRTLGRLGEAMFVLSECERPEARLLADVFHTYKGGGRLGGFRLLGADTLGLLHINDYPASPGRCEITDADRVYPGDGVAPLNDILRGLADAGYAGMLSLEVFNESYWQGEPAAIARIGRERLEAVVQRALLR